MSEVQIPAPLAHQAPVLASPARFKLLRCGRRWGKSRVSLIAAVIGHGEGRWRGIAQGVDVAWIAPDYPQSRAIWREEIRRRFAGVPGVEINEAERRVTLPGGGALEVRSAEAIDGLRGRKLGGVVCDEGAYFDLEYAWTAVLRPALADLGGWAIFPSTPNAGSDGNGEQRVPSFFNLLCQREIQGELGAEWAQFHGTTRDNLRIARDEIRDLYAEYPADSIQTAQELDAKLLAQGTGLALGELKRERHIVPPFDVPEHWERFGALDWGFTHPWSFGAYVVDERGRVYKTDTVTGRGQRPDEIAATILARFPDAPRWRLVAGSDIKSRHAGRLSSTIDVPTIAEQMMDLGLFFEYVEDGPYTLAPRLNNFRRYVAWMGKHHGGEGEAQDGEPDFVWFDTPGNVACFRQCEGMLTDPKKPENPLKKNADPHTGQGGDDMFDETMNALASRPWAASVLPPMRFPTPEEVRDDRKKDALARAAKRAAAEGELDEAPVELAGEGWEGLYN